MSAFDPKRTCSVLVACLCANSFQCGSGLQFPFLEALRCCAELAELVNGRARGRESEWLKRLRDQFVEVRPGSNAGADVRIEVLAGSLRNKSRNIVDQERVNVRIIGGGGESGRISGLHRERGYGGDHVLLQFEQCGGRLRDNAGDAGVPVRNVIVFEGLQLHAGHVGARDYFADGGIDLLKVRSTDETLDHCDVRPVRCVQSEALRVNLEVVCVDAFGMADASGA
jgi:hypothetical protein